MKHCPHCRRPINSTALVDAFNEPDNWLFWGEAGARWIVCKANSYVHFRVNGNGRMQHRLAIIREHAAEWMATEQAASESNGIREASRNHLDHSNYAKATQDDWLDR